MLGTGFGMFSAGVPFATGAGPGDVILTDMTADGHLDIVAANAGDSTIAILRGNGKGGFDAAETFMVGSSPAAVAIGDFNGDDVPDLVTADGAASTVSVLLSDP